MMQSLTHPQISRQDLVLTIRQWGGVSSGGILDDNCYKASQYFFNLSGHETFWEKFQPRQQGSYLIFPHQNISYATIKAIINSLRND